MSKVFYCMPFPILFTDISIYLFDLVRSFLITLLRNSELQKSKHSFSTHSLQMFFSSCVSGNLSRLPWVLSMSSVLLMHSYVSCFSPDWTWIVGTLRRPEGATGTDTHSPVRYNRVPARKPTMLSSLLCRALVAWTWMISLASSLSNLACVGLSACILACLLASGKKQSALFNYSSQII